MAPWTNAVLAILLLAVVSGTMRGVVPDVVISSVFAIISPVVIELAVKLFKPFIDLLLAPNCDMLVILYIYTF